LKIWLFDRLWAIKHVKISSNSRNETKEESDQNENENEREEELSMVISQKLKSHIFRLMRDENYLRDGVELNDQVRRLLEVLDLCHLSKNVSSKSSNKSKKSSSSNLREEEERKSSFSATIDPVSQKKYNLLTHQDERELRKEDQLVNQILDKIYQILSSHVSNQDGENEDLQSIVSIYNLCSHDYLFNIQPKILALISTSLSSSLISHVSHLAQQLMNSDQTKKIENEPTTNNKEEESKNPFNNQSPSEEGEEEGKISSSKNPFDDQTKDELEPSTNPFDTPKQPKKEKKVQIFEQDLIQEESKRKAQEDVIVRSFSDLVSTYKELELLSPLFLSSSFEHVVIDKLGEFGILTCDLLELLLDSHKP